MESPPQASESLGLGAGEQSLGMAQGVGGCVVRMNQEHAKVEASHWAEVRDCQEAPEWGKGRIGGFGGEERVSC